MVACMSSNTTTSDYDAGNRRHVEKKAKTSKQHQRRLADALRWLMADPRGRLLMWQRLSDAGVFRSSFVDSAERTAFNEGRRALGLRDLGQIMRDCPEQYARMAAEAQAAEPRAAQPLNPTTTIGEDDDGSDDSSS